MIIQKPCPEYISKLIGSKINRLTITEYLGTENEKSLVVAKCDCGRVSTYRIASIINGNTKSCTGPCFDMKRKKVTAKHPLYATWKGMLRRCYKTTYKEYRAYGAKGVIVCEEWKGSFKAFYEWGIANGWEQGLQLDKDIKGNGKLYSPDNCCFVTSKINNRHKITNVVVTYKGITATMVEWSEKLGINYSTLQNRIKIRKWDIEKAFTHPVQIQLKRA